MTEKKQNKKRKNSKIGYLLIFILLLTIGILLLALQNTLTGLAIAIGSVLALFGIVFTVFTLARRERDFSFATHMFFSVICIIGGVVVIIARESAVNIIISLSSLFLIVDASFKLNTTAMSKRYAVPLWWIILVISVATIFGGYFLLEKELDVSDASIILGAVFIADAVANLLSAMFISAYEHRQQKEAYLEFYQTKDNPPKWAKKLIKKEGLEKKAKVNSDDAVSQ